MLCVSCSVNQYDQSIAQSVFNVFVTHVATPDRPLYFHTDDASLRRMFTYLNTLEEGSINPQPSIFPYQVGVTVL